MNGVAGRASGVDNPFDELGLQRGESLVTRFLWWFQANEDFDRLRGVTLAFLDAGHPVRNPLVGQLLGRFLRPFALDAQNLAAIEILDDGRPGRIFKTPVVYHLLHGELEDGVDGQELPSPLDKFGLHVRRKPDAQQMIELSEDLVRTVTFVARFRDEAEAVE